MAFKFTNFPGEVKAITNAIAWQSRTNSQLLQWKDSLIGKGAEIVFKLVSAADVDVEYSGAILIVEYSEDGSDVPDNSTNRFKIRYRYSSGSDLDITFFESNGAVWRGSPSVDWHQTSGGSAGTYEFDDNFLEDDSGLPVGTWMTQYFTDIPEDLIGNFEYPSGGNTTGSKFLDVFTTWELNVTSSLDSITPSTGSEFGGTPVTLSGSGFGASQLAGTAKIGGVDIADITTWNDTTIIGVSPAGTIGDEDVVVTPDGGSPLTLVDGFTYSDTLPEITSITPDEGTAMGGTRITITGTTFLGSPGTVTVAGVLCIIESWSDTEIICVTSYSKDTGPQDVVVTNTSLEVVTGVDGFFYNAKTITINGITVPYPIGLIHRENVTFEKATFTTVEAGQWVNQTSRNAKRGFVANVLAGVKPLNSKMVANRYASSPYESNDSAEARLSIIESKGAIVAVNTTGHALADNQGSPADFDYTVDTPLQAAYVVGTGANEVAAAEVGKIMPWQSGEKIVGVVDEYDLTNKILYIKLN